MYRRCLLASLCLLLGAGCTPTEDQQAESMARDEAQQQTVRSADGTRIGYTRIGSGPIPVVIVHGAISSSRSWLAVATSLAEHCTCYVMDRWGRGGSESREEYSFEREAEDIQAVLEVAGSDAYLLGHSSGAIYSLEAALEAPLAGLILYEPPLHANDGRFAEVILPRISEAAGEGRFDEALEIFLVEEAMVPEEALASLRTTPVWEAQLGLTPQSVVEWEDMARAAPAVGRYGSIEVPTLLLAGTETAEHPSFATDDLERLVPNVRTAILEGQGHTAHRMAPDLLAGEVAGFLSVAGE